ncbi:MAG TPA: hypothetical protein VJR88_05240 [Novosphingobium sp.]|nr:hypothetical protein [Novosphingobium sp.]
MKAEQSIAPPVANVSASGRSRGEIGRAENCGQTAHALSGVGWQGGNWLLMACINLFGPGNGFSGIDAPVPAQSISSCIIW